MTVINKIVIYMYFHKNLHGVRHLGHPVFLKIEKFEFWIFCLLTS